MVKRMSRCRRWFRCQINSPACLSILSIRVAESINHDTPNLYLLCASKRVLFMLICDWFPLFHHSTALFEFFASFLLFPIHFKIVFSTHHLIYYDRLAAAAAGFMIYFATSMIHRSLILLEEAKLLQWGFIRINFKKALL